MNRRFLSLIIPLLLATFIVAFATPQEAANVDLERSGRTKIDSVRLEVNRHGFSPASVSVRPGKFFLVLDSATDLPDIAIELREQGKVATLLSQPLRRRSIAGSRTLLTLGVGRYVLRSPSFPEAEATIVVTTETLNK